LQNSFSISNFAARNQYDYKMKTRMMKLLMAVLMLGMPMLQCETFAGTIKVTKKGNDKYLLNVYTKSKTYI